MIWKIESLWKKYFATGEQKPDVHSNYFTRTQVFSFKSSEHIVHADDYGQYHGLAQQQLLYTNKPIYLFDNHNKMVFAMHEYHQQYGVFDVVHIDAHRDDALYPGMKPDRLESEMLGEFVESTRISDFFDAVSETGIVDTIHRVCDSEAFGDYKNPQKPFILSLDIDIFGPEGDFVELEEKIRVIAQAWSGAEAVCIATSPGFIDQDFAGKIIQILFSHKFASLKIPLK
jgi:hypothetical protein